jgi:hypothetical protein
MESRSEIHKVDDVGTFDNPCGWRMGRRTMWVIKKMLGDY